VLGKVNDRCFDDGDLLRSGVYWVHNCFAVYPLFAGMYVPYTVMVVGKRIVFGDL